MAQHMDRFSVDSLLCSVEQTLFASLRISMEPLEDIIKEDIITLDVTRAEGGSRRAPGPAAPSPSPPMEAREVV